MTSNWSFVKKFEAQGAQVLRVCNGAT
jgi:hypothetical protein